MSPNQFGQCVLHTESIRKISPVLVVHVSGINHQMTPSQGCQMTNNASGGSLCHCEPISNQGKHDFIAYSCTQRRGRVVIWKVPRLTGIRKMDRNLLYKTSCAIGRQRRNSLVNTSNKTAYPSVLPGGSQGVAPGPEFNHTLALSVWPLWRCARLSGYASRVILQ